MKDFRLKTPVALIIFNRPDTSAKVFEAIRHVKPSKLLVIADGPRPNRPDDAEKCKAALSILERIDWNCEVLTNYSDVNLGCKKRVSSGLKWVFDRVEEAIILEDDCLPHPTFFRFCEELLEYYRYDRRIMSISGNNFQFGKNRINYSYYFSRHTHIWGWASWKRAWQYYDLEMKLWQEISNSKWLLSVLKEPRFVKYWDKIFQSCYDDKINSWAYAWTFSCWIQNALTILPCNNLVTNIGFGVNATHTTNQNDLLANMMTQEMVFPLKHPSFMLPNDEADNFTEQLLFNLNFFKKVKIKIKNMGLQHTESRFS
jgi:hypothetical protein